MHLSKRSSERASEIQRSTLIAWYAAVCFVICVAGAVWLASLFGVLDFDGGTTNPAAYKAAAKEAAQRAAAQQLQARLTALEEARNIAADAERLIKPPTPTPPVDPAESSSSAAGAASDARPVAPATAKPAPQ